MNDGFYVSAESIAKFHHRFPTDGPIRGTSRIWFTKTAESSDAEIDYRLGNPEGIAAFNEGREETGRSYIGGDDADVLFLVGIQAYPVRGEQQESPQARRRRSSRVSTLHRGAPRSACVHGPDRRTPWS